MIVCQIEKQIRLQRFVWYVVLTSFVAFITTLVYWYFEPDPFVVERVDGQGTWSECTGRQYSFSRSVKTTKALNIYIQERWHDSDGMMDFAEKQGEFVVSTPIHYPLGKDFEKIMQFNKVVPIPIGVGRYEYRPWATYQINPIKTVTKLLPVQNVDVRCDYDPTRHGSAVK